MAEGGRDAHLRGAWWSICALTLCTQSGLNRYADKFAPPLT
jgi:hypothetical protein